MNWGKKLIDENRLMKEKLTKLRMMLTEERNIRKGIFEGTVKKYDDLSSLIEDVSFSRSDSGIRTKLEKKFPKQKQEMSKIMHDYNELSNMLTNLEDSHDELKGQFNSVRESEIISRLGESLSDAQNLTVRKLWSHFSNNSIPSSNRIECGI
jgi:hypothetical protein